jgi:hypothetical protein|eukprot:COSAG06_NODE_13194_length_1283_cov_8.667230_3_plen_51_part_01
MAVAVRMALFGWRARAPCAGEREAAQVVTPAAPKELAKRSEPRSGAVAPEG